MADTLTIPVVRCTRCKSNHRAVRFKKFQRKLESDGAQYWASCPKTKEPILMMIVDK